MFLQLIDNPSNEFYAILVLQSILVITNIFLVCSCMQSMERPSKFIFILFALGQLGWSLTCFAVCNCVTYFYSPPISQGHTEFPLFIEHLNIFGLFTLLGAIVLSSFIPDALSNFIVAAKSDSDKSAIGRRKKYMLLGIFPFAISSVLVFHPPVAHTSLLNALWFACSLFIFYISWAMYMTPYNALINDLGRSPEERLQINTYISITWALGFLIGNSVYFLKSLLEKQVSSLHAFQISIVLFAFVGFLLMLIPIVFINENKYTRKQDALNEQKPLLQSIRIAFQDKNFAYFVCSDTIYWLASNTISVCLVYYVVSLLKMPEAYTSLIGLCVLIGSFIMYIPINYLSKKVGKKKLQQGSYILLAVSFLLIFFLGQFQLSATFQLALLGLVIIFPLASFGILPNAMMSDLIEYTKEKDGNYNAALYFSIKTVMMKLGVHISNFILFALIPIGQGTSYIGIRLTAIVAFLAAILGLLLFSKYQEHEVLNTQKSI